MPSYIKNVSFDIKILYADSNSTGYMLFSSQSMITVVFLCVWPINVMVNFAN